MKQLSWRLSVLPVALVTSLGLAWSPSSYGCPVEPYISSVCIMASMRYNINGFARADGALMAVNQNQALFSLIGNTYGGDGSTNFKLPNLQGRVVVGAGTYSDTGGTVSYTPGSTGGQRSVTLTTAQIPLAPHSHTLNANASPQAPLARANWANGTLAANTTLGTLAGTVSGSSLVLNASTGGNLVSNPAGATLGTYAGATKVYSDAAPTVAMKASSITGTAAVSFTGTPSTTLTGSPTVTISGTTDSAGAATASAPISTMPPYLVMNYLIATLGIYPSFE